MTSSPDKRLGLGIYEFDLKGQQNLRIGGQSEVGKIFAFQMKSNCLLKVRHSFVEGRSLGNDSNLEALRNEIILAFSNHGLDVVL